MRYLPKLITIIAIILLLAFVFITQALAFDGRSGDQVVIGAEEVVNDDLYVTAQELTQEGGGTPSPLGKGKGVRSYIPAR